jgi:hypothetical protein
VVLSGAAVQLFAVSRWETSIRSRTPICHLQSGNEYSISRTDPQLVAAATELITCPFVERSSV